MAIPKPPGHLKADGRRLWRSVIRDFSLEDHHLPLLETACVALDRSVAARELLDAEGLTCRDARGSLKPHPAIEIEKSSRVLLLRSMRELSLDNAVEESRRPPRIAGGRRYA